MDTVLGIAIGLGLAASCGFRVFVPLLIMCVAARGGHLDLAQGFAWVGSDTAFIGFGTATVLEVFAYFIPWLDNALDVISGPAAAIAGTVAAAAVIVDLSPAIKWAVAIIAGGGLAATVKTSTSMVRATSTMTTAGVANPAIAAGETASSVATSILAIMLPVVCLILLSVGMIYSLRRFGPFRRR